MWHGQPLSLQEVFSSRLYHDVINYNGVRARGFCVPHFMQQEQPSEAQEREAEVHITSLLPLNSRNQPNQWERQALLTYGQDQAKIVKQVVKTGDKAYLYVIRFFKYHATCLSCHRSQPYAGSDMRGGASLKISLNPLYARKRSEKQLIIGAHLLMMVLGLVIIGSFIAFLQKEFNRNAQMEKTLSDEKNKAVLANQSKTHFLAAMSHDLRAPLNSIIGFSELALLSAEEGTLGVNQKSFISRVADAGHHLLSLVDDLQEITLIEAGRIKLKKELLDLNQLIVKVIETHQLIADQKEIKLTADLTVERTVSADRHRLIEILNNLITNALKFTPPQGQITIEAQQQPHQMVIRVKDTGIGVDEADVERIFLMFEQGENGHSMKGGLGSGLGLAISKRLVELHRGRLNVISKKGEGSCFFFTLPFDETDKS
jgi:signal transduction histidine kinase